MIADGHLGTLPEVRPGYPLLSGRDELTHAAGSVYSLVNITAKRTRQLTAFHAQLGEGMIGYAGPVARRGRREALSIALREVHEGLLSISAVR